MPATTGERVGVGIIAFLMILSVVGGSLLYAFQQDVVEKQAEELQEVQEEQDLLSLFFSECSAAATATINDEEIDVPEAFMSINLKLVDAEVPMDIDNNVPVYKALSAANVKAEELSVILKTVPSF